MAGLDKHVAGLEQEREKLGGELDKARAQVRTLQAEIARVDAGLRGLKSSKAGRRVSGRGVTGEEVREYARAVLAEQGPLPSVVLQEEIAKRARESGKPLTGIAMRIGELLRSAVVAREGELVSLCEEAAE